MPNVWNLGNTTIRNPNRIELGLRLFSEEFQGNVHGAEAEERFAKRLAEEEIVESEGSYGDLFGRKWRSVLVKLGFATDIKYIIGKRSFKVVDLAKQRPELGLKGLEYELTPAGKHLLEADTTGAIQDVFLRQLVRHELPSPIESGFPRGQIKPFIYVLQVLKKLLERNEQGLSKFEMAAFLQLFIDHTDNAIEQTVERVLEYRKQRDTCDDQAAKRKFDETQIQASALAGNVKSDTLVDYADTTFRYTQMTGIVAQQGSRLILRENKMPIIEALLIKEPAFLAREDPFGYLADFYTGTSLPTDNITFANSEIKRLVDEIRKYGKEPALDMANLSVTMKIQEIERLRYNLLEQLSWAREDQFAADQVKDESIQDILKYIDALETLAKSKKMGILDRPAYLEWVVWRGFLAIDRIIIPFHQTRRFPVNEDLHPRHPAPGGGSDMIFEFEDYVLVVEVTLTGSSRQIAAEGEPVRRHVADIKEKYANKEVYGIFIAPSIDNNTAETFRIGIWYRGDLEEFMNIVPFTLNQFRQMIETLLKQRYSPKNIQQLMDRCLTYRNTKAPEWKRMIDVEKNRWIARLD